MLASWRARLWARRAGADAPAPLSRLPSKKSRRAAQLEWCCGWSFSSSCGKPVWPRSRLALFRGAQELRPSSPLANSAARTVLLAAHYLAGSWLSRELVRPRLGVVCRRRCACTSVTAAVKNEPPGGVAGIHLEAVDVFVCFAFFCICDVYFCRFV